MQKKVPTVAIVISLAATVAALLRIAYPDLKIDAVTLGLGILAVLPWLAPLFKSVKLPGGWELVFQDIQRQVTDIKGQVQETKGAAANAEHLAQAAFSGATTHLPAADNREQARQPEGRRAAATPSRYEELMRLADAYNHIRKTQRGGNERTEAMTGVVTQMITLAHKPQDSGVAELDGFDVKRALREEDGGRRLAAYAYLYANPNFELLTDLVNSVIDIDDTPFGQYWGIQAVGKVIGGRKKTDIDPQLPERLEQFLALRLKPGSDRYYALSRILRDL
jgi:hypothetical protein